MARYNIYFRRYSIFGRAYSSNILVVETEDIYHEVGKIICKSLEHIDQIRYTAPKASREECEKYWLENGYKKISDNFYLSDKPFLEGAAPDIDIDIRSILSVIKEAGILSVKKNDYDNFLHEHCYLFEDLTAYEFVGVYPKCRIKDGCLYDSEGNFLCSNGDSMVEEIPYFVDQITGYLGDDYHGTMFIKVGFDNTFVAVRYEC